eukprot:2835263-Ditylum_brightwellii.AAC.1
MICMLCPDSMIEQEWASSDFGRNGLPPILGGRAMPRIVAKSFEVVMILTLTSKFAPAVKTRHCTGNPMLR